MKVLIYDNTGEGRGLDLALRALDANHEVRFWLPPFPTGKPRSYGQGMIEKVIEWRPSMDWAELIVLTWNADHVSELAEYFGKGYPIFGCNPKAAELEADRALGQKVLEEAGVKTIPYKIVSSAEEAIALVVKTGQGYAMKPWGGEADKAMTCVCTSADDAIFTILRWKKEGKFKGQLMMQECVSGVEVGISGFFGPSGWSRALEESFEHKKFLNDDLGENTGEMGTVIRHVLYSKLFKDVLEPVGDYLHKVNYVGDCSVNCIVDSDGRPLPLEFTMRLGWPDFCIRQALIESDPVEWMLDLINGKDSLSVSPEIAVGVCMVHGDFPRGSDARPKDPIDTWSGYPIKGITSDNYPSLHFQQVLDDKTDMLVGGKVVPTLMTMTAGNYPLVVTGTGRTVASARISAYMQAQDVRWPSNVMYRTDIGKRLENDLPILQEHGFCRGMKYG